jgi:uncharacterized protein (TIGR03437 family)
MANRRVENHMRPRTGWVWLILGWSAWTVGAFGQTATNQSLSGKFFFRHVSLLTDSTGNLTDPRSLQGTLNFDGAGNYSFTGQQVIGNNAAANQTGSGKYSVDPAGVVSLDNPIRTGAKVNARLGTEALLGSSTEATDNSFDIFVAIPAPASTAKPALSGSYWAATLEFPGGSAANERNTFFAMTAGSAAGTFADISVSGHAANLSSGIPTIQTVTGATYVVNTDGTGTVSFGTASTASLLSGTRNLYISADGNILLGGSAATGSHDILIGVKAMSGVTNGSWKATFWGAGLRSNLSDTAQALDYAGAVNAGGSSNLIWTKRLKSLGQSNLDFTAVNTYSLNGDGSGAVPLTSVALGAAGSAFISSTIDVNDSTAYEIGLGVTTIAQTGPGVFVFPQGVVSAASFAPAGNPISPGEFIAIFGSGLAKSTQTATAPFPTGGVNGVTVLINGKSAPIYFVSTGQINCLVPYSTQGPTATVVVQNGGASNTVTVPVAATSPGIYAYPNLNGIGPGAILHATGALNGTVVSAISPATSGETVSVYLTGLGTVNNSPADGTAVKDANSTTTVQPAVYVAGVPAKVLYSGLAPNYPGLYQLNITLPAPLPASGPLPLAILTPNAYHDQVTIQAVQ